MSPGQLRSLIPISWLISLVVLSVVFASPGIWINHFVDVEILSVLLLGWMIAAQGERLANFLLNCMLLIVIFSTALILRNAVVYDLHRDTFKDAQDVVDYVGRGPQPLISEDPMIPLLAGEKVVVPEPYMVRVVSEKSKPVQEEMVREIHDRSFRAIIFLKDPEKSVEWYLTNHFGTVFMAEMFTEYARGRQIGQYFVYVPLQRELKRE
jgi:hypothetical protein